MEGQTTIFDMLYPKYKITKPIRLIEFFGGYGSQALALKYLGVKFEHWKLVEWAVKSIQAYKDIHFSNDDEDYSDFIDKDTLINILYGLGISQNYNEPMTKQQIARLSENQLRKIYNNIRATNNLVNIQQVKGEDLCITDTNEFTYLLTYSFPCQDLSLAGKGKGMSDTSTRSGLLWEVERILSECKEKPQILLMENVPQVHSEDNLEDFNKWKYRLEEMGYKNYFQDLIATDYEIPQTRNRTFMVSLLGDYSYTFPKPILLKLKLKDMLEDNVNEKYYLSDKMKQYIFSEDDKYKVNKSSLKLDRDIACSKTTREGWTRADTSDYITEDNKTIRKYGLFDKGDKIRQAGSVYDENGTSPTIDTGTGGYRQPMIEENGCKQVLDLNYYNHEQSNRVYSIEYSCPTLRTKCDDAGTIKIEVGNKSLKETLQQKEINDTCYIDTYNKRIDKEKSGTITTGVSFRNNTFLAIKNNTTIGYLEATEGDGINIQGRMEYQRGNVQKDKAHTLNTMGGENAGVVDSNLRIRKLTPRECFRLMGVKDEDYNKVAKNQSDSSLYHLAGDSIVVNVLMAIFKELL